ncbi:MAG: HIT family protein [Planctomycetes bacterium]|nr:HIT family protein [Planctomycetota bacterium]
MATLFTRIIDGELPGHFVWKDARCVVFLSIQPLRPGHALVVPRAEVDHWIDVPPDLSAHLFDVARTIGLAQQRAFSPVKVGLVILGLEVRHTHLHLVPMQTERDLDFSRAKSATSDELAAAATTLRAALRELGHAEADWS